jgi:cytochrome P450
MTFGVGPRNCIGLYIISFFKLNHIFNITFLNKGMKFAMIELKLSLIKILKAYELLPTQNIPDKLDYIEGFVRLPNKPISVIFKKRA